MTATLDRDTVPVGESFTLTLTFQDANPGATPSLPALRGLTLGGVGNSQELVLVNGQMSSKLSFNYTLTATQIGEITIPAMAVRVDGQDLKTAPLKVKVVNGGAGPAAEAANKSAFLKLVVSKNEIFLGEALIVDMNLYVAEGRDAHVPQLLSSGFTVGPVQQQGQTRTRVGNQIFNLVPFRTFVSPVRSGQLAVGPATMQLSIPKPNARRSIFGDIVDWLPITLTSETQTVNVLRLPRTNVPPTFNGAVGSLSMNVIAGPTNVAVGDPITLKVTISGQGILDSLALPSQPAWSNFTVYPATSKSEPADPFGLSGTKRFEQVVIPKAQEIVALPAFEFTYFDPNQRIYRTLSGPTVPLIVRPTAALGSLPGVNPNRPAMTNGDEIVRIKPYLGMSPVTGPPLVQRPWFVAAQSLPLLAWVSLLAMRRRNEALAKNPRLRRQREVSRKIADELAQLRKQAEERKSDAFFATVFRMLQEQLGERLDLPASAITEAVIEEHLRPRKVPEQTLAALQELFHACNQALYAPQRSSQELASFIPRVEATLQELATISA